MKNENLNPTESLSLINEMITQARNNFQKGAGDSTIIAGCSVATVAIINFVLLHVCDNPNNTYWVWLLMFPMSIITTFISNKRFKSASTTTHFDTIIGEIWMVFGYSNIFLLGIIFGIAYIFETPYPLILISPVILIFTGMAQYITGVTCKFKPYRYSAIVFAIASLLCLVSFYYGDGKIQFIILAVAYILGFVIPGNMLNKKAKQHV